MKTSFSDHLAFITGASQGIGKAIAGELVAQGCSVVGVGLESSPLQETERELRQQAGNGDVIIRILACDVTDPKAVASVVEQTIQRYGVPDLLILWARARGDSDPPPSF